MKVKSPPRMFRMQITRLNTSIVSFGEKKKRKKIHSLTKKKREE